MTQNANPTSIRARLKNRAATSPHSFNELLQLYGMERLLYRLGESAYANQFMLKGGLLLIALGAPQTRTTRDIDLLGFGANSTDHLLGGVSGYIEQ